MPKSTLKYWFMFLLAIICFIVALYLQPLLEVNGRVMQLITESFTWLFADPTRGYLSGLVLVLLATIGSAVLILATDNRVWLATLLVKIAICFVGFGAAVYVLALVSWCDHSTTTSWFVLLGWIPLLLAVLVAAYHALSAKFALVTFTGTLGYIRLTGMLGSWFHALVLTAIGAVAMVAMLYVFELIAPSYWGPQLKSDGPHLSRSSLERTLIGIVAVLIVGTLLYVVLWQHEQLWLPTLVSVVCLGIVAISIATIRHKVPIIHPF